MLISQILASNKGSSPECDEGNYHDAHADNEVGEESDRDDDICFCLDVDILRQNANFFWEGGLSLRILQVWNWVIFVMRGMHDLLLLVKYLWLFDYEKAHKRHKEDQDTYYLTLDSKRKSFHKVDDDKNIEKFSKHHPKPL